MGVLKKFANIVRMASLFLFVLSVSLRADIPETDDFADGAEDKGGVETLFWLLETFLQVAVIAIAGFFVLNIGRSAIEKYKEVTDGRASWIDLGGHIIGGVALLTLTIVMLNWIGTWVE